MASTVDGDEANDPQDSIGRAPLPSPAEDAGEEKPDFLIDSGDLPDAAHRLMRLLPQKEDIYNRGGDAVVLQREAAVGRLSSEELTPDGVVMLAHRHVRPCLWKRRGDALEVTPVTLSDRLARLCLSPAATKALPILAGITRSPLLTLSGELVCRQGYDAASRMYCDGVPEVSVPARPTREDAEAALARLRTRIRTFPFADSKRVRVDGYREPVVDVTVPPGNDESTFLVATMTAICRQSMNLAPGLAISAPYASGAGSGKGLLVRYIGLVAFGLHLRALTAGHNAEEMDKRIVSAIRTTAPAIFLDNVNDVDLKSNLIASVITESPACVRVLRRSELREVTASLWFCVTGNGLRLTEDLRRRFLLVQLDPGQENPENRSFSGDFLEDVGRDRQQILSDYLTVARWGLQNAERLERGKPLGSFGAWERMCRDPLLNLGCVDPVVVMAEHRQLDPIREELLEIIQEWWRYHGDSPVEAKDLHQAVMQVLNPYGKPRQYVANRLMRLKGTIAGGFKFEVLPKDGKWPNTKYKLTQLQPFGPNGGSDDSLHPPARRTGPVRRADAPSIGKPFRVIGES